VTSTEATVRNRGRVDVPSANIKAVSEERCDHSELPVSSCGCPQHGGPSQRYVPETAAPPPAYTGPRPRPDDILVSRTGTAHRSGCDHLPDYRYLIPPQWGWIEDPKVWPRIGPHAITSTGGRTSRVAVRRCLDCDT
jgi:hypothetical protein